MLRETLVSGAEMMKVRANELYSIIHSEGAASDFIQNIMDST